MSHFKAKMHQNRVRLRPRWGSLQHSPRTSSWNKGILLLREGKGCREGKEGRRGKGGRDGKLGRKRANRKGKEREEEREGKGRGGGGKGRKGG